MRLASYVPGELIPCAFVWLDPGITPCCKSRWRPFLNNDFVALMRFALLEFEAWHIGRAWGRSLPSSCSMTLRTTEL